MILAAKETNQFPFDEEKVKFIDPKEKPCRRDFGVQTEPEGRKNEELS